MKSISTSDLRSQLTSILEDLADGPVNITKHGKTVAVISAPGSLVKASAAPPPTAGTSDSYERFTRLSEPEMGTVAEEEYESSHWPTWEDHLDDEFETYLKEIGEMPKDRPAY